MKPQVHQHQKNSIKRVSKNILFAICGLLLILTGCSGSDDAPTPPITQSFTFDNSTYSLLGTQGIVEAKMEHVFDIDGVFYNRSSISVIGLIGFSKTATVSFDLYYKDGMSVGGTYTIYQEDDSMTSFEDFMSPLDRACMGWTTAGYAVNMSNSTDFSANNPSGTVKVIVNSPTNYTLQYSGNFRVYDDGFTFVRNAPTTVNVTGTVDIHESN
jgi:hypothetical protein